MGRVLGEGKERLCMGWGIGSGKDKEWVRDGIGVEEGGVGILSLSGFCLAIHLDSDGVL